MSTMVPDFLSHYYEAAAGPFSNLSMLPPEQAERILEGIRQRGDRFASQRAGDYLQVRRGLEELVRKRFIERGGKPKLARPHYMILGACPWLLGWYADGRGLRIPLKAFCADTLSFTYGDTFPAMRLKDGKPYRGQVYVLSELEEVVGLYGLPQEWNPDGRGGAERYIEAQVWDEELLQKYLQA
jgi:hypothetical protein